ncbi:MAG TPA: hypothetical protein ENN36_00160 [Candidatus Bathyarchaeota archaeon]|nr:hypothetical protein [Candidatus Bathyarchaeota archaeon]
MPQKIKATGIDRDDEFAIFKKRIAVPEMSSFETPTKSAKNIHNPYDFKINEIVKRVTPELIDSIYSGQGKYQSPRVIKDKCIKGKLNLTIFDLTYDKVPPKPKITTIINYLYACSQHTLFLPTVRTALFKEGNKISDKRFQQYVEMVEHMITTTENVGNRLDFIGTIPLLAPKFTRKMVNLYADKGINSFAIDCGIKDILNHVAEFRTILSEISQRMPLENSFIYACNLGIPRYEANTARADDFLSLLAYVDVLGTNFKTRGWTGESTERRAKQFVKDRLVYKVSNYSEFCKERNMSTYQAQRFLYRFNYIEQLNEAHNVRDLVGEEKIEVYLKKKNGVNEDTKKRLGSIAKNIKIS